MTLEIHLPVRNPTKVIERTIESLVVQTARDFTVVLSDNHSSKGSELIDQAISRLNADGISARKVVPPSELDRVEHWNWLHAEAKADWVKPLFVGDWLEPACIERLAAACICDYPAARFMHVGYHYHHDGRPTVDVAPAGLVQFRPPAEARDAVLKVGHHFGPPSTYLFARDAFLALGGYRPSLPICADSLLCCTLAARFGVVAIPELLANFHIHDARFSTQLGSRRRAIFRETATYYLLLLYHAWTEQQKIPWVGVARMIARHVRNYLYGR